jgi:hypothetical protein
LNISLQRVLLGLTELKKLDHLTYLLVTENVLCGEALGVDAHRAVLVPAILAICSRWLFPFLDISCLSFCFVFASLQFMVHISCHP